MATLGPPVSRLSNRPGTEWGWAEMAFGQTAARNFVTSIFTSGISNSGHLGVINYIRTLGMEQHISPENFSRSLENEDTIVSTYFRTLKNELEQARN